MVARTCWIELLLSRTINVLFVMGQYAPDLVQAFRRILASENRSGSSLAKSALSGLERLGAPAGTLAARGVGEAAAISAGAKWQSIQTLPAAS